MHPKDATTRSIKVIRVVRNSGPGGFSMAELSNGIERLWGIRWNGEADSNGYPTSRGHPVWFLLPEEMVQPLLVHYQALKNAGLELDVEM